MFVQHSYTNPNCELISTLIDHGLRPWSGQTKDYEISFSASPLNMKY